MDLIVPMPEISPGERGRIVGLRPDGKLNCRLMDLGFTAGAFVTCLFHSMFGDPSAYEICGTVVALRAADGASVLVEPMNEEKV